MGRETWSGIEEHAEPGVDDALFPDRGIPVLRPYVAVGSARAIEDGEPVSTYVLVHESAELAAEECRPRPSALPGVP